MDLNDLERQRVEKLERLQEAGVDPYPPRAHRTHTTQEAIEAYESAADTDIPEVTVAGRVVSFRAMGKLSFAHIEDATGRLQLFIRKNELGDDAYDLFRKTTDLGDFVEASGPMMKTRTGEISVQTQTVRMLAKAVTPLPIAKVYEDEEGEVTRYGAFSDVEERYRQRYADLAVNPEVREVFRIRSRTISALRRWLDEHGFLEVETPILQPIYGGAAARPFTTYHNQLKQDLYLRIAFELYLKRLLVGMYERVYEIGRDFRNEGVSYKHNPEFTMLEFYCAYTDLYGVMTMVEEMVASTAESTLGQTTLTYQDRDIDLAPPWQRVTLRDVIRHGTGIDYAAFPEADTLRAEMRARGYDAASDATWGQSTLRGGARSDPTDVCPRLSHRDVALGETEAQRPDPRGAL